MSQPVCANCNNEIAWGKSSHEEPKDNKVTEVFCMTCARHLNDEGTCICGMPLKDRKIEVLDPTIQVGKGVRFRLPEQQNVVVIRSENPPELTEQPVQASRHFHNTAAQDDCCENNCCINYALMVSVTAIACFVLFFPFLGCTVDGKENNSWNRWWPACFD